MQQQPAIIAEKAGCLECAAHVGTSLYLDARPDNCNWSAVAAPARSPARVRAPAPGVQVPVPVAHSKHHVVPLCCMCLCFCGSSSFIPARQLYRGSHWATRRSIHLKITFFCLSISRRVNEKVDMKKMAWVQGLQYSPLYQPSALRAARTPHAWCCCLIHSGHELSIFMHDL